MAIVNGYCTRGELSDELGDDSGAALDSGRLDRLAQQAARLVDAYTGHLFYPTVATKYFTAKYAGWVDVSELLTVTALETDGDGDRTYENTWTATDYDLEPANAADVPEPYSMVLVAPEGTYTFPLVRRGVKITGVWGYYEVPAESGSLLAAAIASTTATSITVDDGDDFSVGHLLKIDDEYLRVDAVDTGTDVLTVVRGVNGSTAATHLNDATVYVLDFPGIKMATLRLATRLWHLRKAPMGIATAGVAGFDGTTAGTRWIQRDEDLKNMLAPYSGGKML